MKTVLILGCGYVGRAVGLNELGQGNRVLAVTRNEAMADQLRSDGMEVSLGNVHETDWHWFAKDVDWALNCVSSFEPSLEGYRTSYIDGNRSFLEWMMKSGFAGIAVYTSSVSVYPESAGELLTEADARASSERSAILLESEALFLEPSRAASRTVLRLGGIYGPGRSFLADRIANSEGRLPGYGDYFLNLVRLEDLVSAIEKTFRAGTKAAGIFNVVDDEALLKESLVVGLAKKMDLETPQFDSSLHGERSSRRFDGKRPANRRISNRKLKETLGWKPVYPNALIGMEPLVSS